MNDDPAIEVRGYVGPTEQYVLLIVPPDDPKNKRRAFKLTIDQAKSLAAAFLSSAEAAEHEHHGMN